MVAAKAKRFEKDVLRVGTFHPQGRKPEEFNSKRLTHLAMRAKEMIAAGLPIPLCWEHNADSTPAERSKNHITFADEFKLSDDGRLLTAFNADDEADAKQLQKVRFVSPHIRTDFKDGTGRVWPGESILHIAVTPRPVNTDQKPFQEVPALALSHDLYLSLADLQLAAETDNEDGNPPGESGGGGAEAKFKKVCEALASYGIVLSDDVTPETFWDHIMTAIETKKATEEGAPEDDAELEQATVPSEPGQTVSMSLEAATNRLKAMERKDLLRRIDKLAQTCRVPKPVADKLRKEAETIELSLGQDGTLAASPLVAKVDAYEALPQGKSFKAKAGGPDDDKDDDDELDRATPLELSAEERGTVPTTKKETAAAIAEWDKTA